MKSFYFENSQTLGKGLQCKIIYSATGRNKDNA